MSDKKKKMSDEELGSLVDGILTDCIAYVDTELSPVRAKATDYYKGRPLGNEEDGRSQMVMTEVRDSILGVLPPLIEVFFGSDRVVEFEPTNAQTVAAAEQATDYVQYVFAEDNAGFLLTHAVLKDGLLKRLGAFKWGWDKTTDTKAYTLDAVTQSELEALAADDKVKLTRVEQLTPGSPGTPGTPPPQGAQAPDPGASPPQQPTPPVEATYSVACTVETNNGRVKLWAIPPEELVFSRNGRTIQDALCVAHHTEQTRSELIALGVEEDYIDEHGGPDNGLKMNLEEITRRQDPVVGVNADPQAGDANDKHAYDEAYIFLDYDGDGIAELRKICTLGPTHWPIPGMNTPVDSRPFAIFCPDPEPHTIVGDSWADRTMDLQRLSSMLMRGTLDSLALSIFPRMAYVEGKANITDILNTEIGAPIRMREVGAVQSITHPWVGRDAIPMFEVINDIKEQRTGQAKGTVGLDGDALQSTGADAVHAAVSASQAQERLLARIFAEGTLKPLFKGILGLLIAHQDKARTLKLRGTWVDVDPAVWDANMAVTCNAGLGPSFTERKIATLMSIAAKQQEIITQLGPTNPLCSLSQYRDTLARICELQGFKDASQYFKPVDPNWQPPAPPPPQPSPEMIEQQTQVQVEKMKSDLALQIKEAELGLEQQKIALDHERRLTEYATDHQLKRYELELKYHAQISGAQLNADVQREESSVAHAMTAHDQAHDQALEVHDQLHSHAMDEDAQQHSQAMDEQAAAAQPQGATPA